MKMKGSYKPNEFFKKRFNLVCDMEVKGGYKYRSTVKGIVMLVCDMGKKGNNRIALSIVIHICN